MSIDFTRKLSAIFFLMLAASTTALDGLIHTEYGLIIIAITPISFALVLFHLFLGEKFNKYVSFHTIAYFFIFWTSISYIWTTTPGDTAWRLFILNIYFMIILFVFWYSITNKKSLLHAYLSYVAAIILFSFVTISNFTQGVDEGGSGRFTAFGIGSNEMSITFAIGILISLYLFSEFKHRIIKLVLILSIPLLTFSIFLTGSRTGFIILLVGFFFGFYRLTKAGLFGKITASISIIAAVSFLAQFLPKDLISRILSTGQSLSSGTLNEREVVWQIGFDGWKEHPIMGSGVDSFERMSNLAHMDLEAHNTYLSILVEYGLIGFSLYGLVIVILLLNIAKVKGAEKVFLSLLMLQIILGQFTVNLHDNTILWSIYALIISHCVIYQRHLHRVEQESRVSHAT